VHCQIVRYDDGGFGVVDLGSTNGTFVNGRRIAGEVRLNWNDTVQIGNSPLHWHSYFERSCNKKKMPIWAFGVSVTALALTVIGALLLFNTRSGRDIIFDGKYPSIQKISITDGGEEYQIEAVSGQVLMYFKDNTPYSEARKIIEHHGGTIIEQMPKYDYYLVDVPNGYEARYSTEMGQEPCVQYAFLNMVTTIASQIHIMDAFYYDERTKMIHGDEVRNTFETFSSRSTYNSIHDVSGGPTSWSEILNGLNPFTDDLLCKRLNMIMEQADDNELILINRSLALAQGKDLGEERDDEGHTVQYKAFSSLEKRRYQRTYIKQMERLAICFEKLENSGKSNFIMTNSSGNEGVHNLDELVLNELDDQTRSILMRHLILVNATVDISDDSHSGTSFSAPKLLGYIDQVANEYKSLNAQDILGAVRSASPSNPQKPLSFESLRHEAQKVADTKEIERQTIEYISSMDSKPMQPSSSYRTASNINLSDEWRWVSDNRVIDNAGNNVPDADFTLVLEQKGNIISGYYLAVAMGGNKIDIGLEINEP
jgi:hypothetical protein